jgi:hypothetical protein
LRVVEGFSNARQEDCKMRSLIALAGAGAAGAFWSKLPSSIKAPVVIGLGILAVSELNKDANESWFANAIYGGQGAQGSAQIVDPKKTEADMKAGKPVTGAAATTAMQVEGLAADAVQKGVTADAMAESEDELLAKQKRGVKLSSTEALRLSEIKTRRAEARSKEVEAALNEAWLPLGLKFAHQMENGVPGDPFDTFGLPGKRH